MLSIGTHHKQAVIKLINCITNANAGHTRPAVTAIDSTIFEKLTQIIKVYEKVINTTEGETDTTANIAATATTTTSTITTTTAINDEVVVAERVDPSQETDQMGAELKCDVEANSYVRSWLSANYNCEQLIDDLFCHWLTDPNNDCFGVPAMPTNEDRLWTITLLVLNILYKMRNCLSEHKMMLELGWICLSELDMSLAQFRPNYNQILNVLQNALKEEKRDNKKYAEDCQQLSQEVKRLRQKIIELQRNIIKVNKDKQVLGKREAISKSNYHKQLAKSSAKRSQSAQHYEDEGPEADGDCEGGSKRRRKGNAVEAVVGTFSCEICSKSFGSSYRLQRHMYSHTGLRPYTCLWPACSRQFNDNYHLKRHMLSHTGEKPYVCQSSDCSRRFARPEDLRTHQKTHWRQSDTQIDFVCNQSLEEMNLRNEFAMNIVKYEQSLDQ